MQNENHFFSEVVNKKIKKYDNAQNQLPFARMERRKKKTTLIMETMCKRTSMQILFDLNLLILILQIFHSLTQCCSVALQVTLPQLTKR